jgi:hypothetical protein
MIPFVDYQVIREGIDYHLQESIPFSDNIFRIGSPAYIQFFREARNLDESLLDDQDKSLLKSDIGYTGMYEGTEVPLDIPMIAEEEEKKELNKPKRGGNKKFYVYVKNDKGNVIKVEFGDTTGLKAKINDPAARKSFVARHKCETKNDKTKPGYWSCRLPWFAKALGLEGGGKFFW